MATDSKTAEALAVLVERAVERAVAPMRAEMSLLRVELAASNEAKQSAVKRARKRSATVVKRHLAAVQPTELQVARAAAALRRRGEA